MKTIPLEKSRDVRSSLSKENRGLGRQHLFERRSRTSHACSVQANLKRGGHPRPFAVLTMCLNELCRGMAAFSVNDTNEFSFPALIRRVLDKEEIGILARVAPNLASVMGTIEYQQQQEEDLAPLQSANDIERLKFILRNFLVAVATKDKPVVFFWDDLQWIDAASFEVLKAISHNCELRCFLFVGAFRIDEVSDDHIVKEFINGLPHPIHITITNLTSTDLSNMLRVAFDLRDHHKDRIKCVQELADLLHRRTDGNIFYVLEILDYLQAAELLTYDTLNFYWTWNIDRIQPHKSIRQYGGYCNYQNKGLSS